MHVQYIIYLYVCTLYIYVYVFVYACTVGDQQLEFGINWFFFEPKNPEFFSFTTVRKSRKKTPQIEYEHMFHSNLSFWQQTSM